MRFIPGTRYELGQFRIWYGVLKLLKSLGACSYDPACRDVSPSGTDISVRSYEVFRPACRDEILLLALAKHVHLHNYLTILAFFIIYLQQKALF